MATTGSSSVNFLQAQTNNIRAARNIKQATITQITREYANKA